MFLQVSVYLIVFSTKLAAQLGPTIGGLETEKPYKNLAKAEIRHEIKRKAAGCEDEMVNAKPKQKKCMVKPVSHT